MATPPSLSLKREDLKDASGEWVEKLVRSLTSFGQQTRDAFDRNISILANLNASLKTLDITTKDDWIAPTLLNSWVNYETPQVTQAPAGYRKAAGIAHMRGLIKSGSIGGTAFVLPVGVRPQYISRHACDSNEAFGSCYIIPSTGALVIGAGSNAWFDLTTSFVPLDPSPVPNPIFPVVFKHGLKGMVRPLSVLATDVLDVTASASGSHASTTVTWEVSGDSVRILDLPGLYANRHYRVTFLVLGG